MSMASETLIPVEEYLRMHSDGPEPDYLDGQIVERHLGSKPHSRAQKRLLLFFEALSKSFRLDAYPELTLKHDVPAFELPDLGVTLSAADVFA